MAISKEYDEMTDITKYSTPTVRVGGGGFINKLAKQLVAVHLSMRVVVGIDSGEVFAYIIFSRRGKDWSWINDSSTIFLVDGVRTQGEGLVTNHFTSTSGYDVFCNEVVSQEVDLDYLQAISDCTTIKFRVGKIDFVPPEEFFPNLEELLAVTKNLGK